MQHFDNFKASFKSKIMGTINFLTIVSLSTNGSFFGEKVSNLKTPAHLHFEGEEIGTDSAHMDMERMLHFHTTAAIICVCTKELHVW